MKQGHVRATVLFACAAAVMTACEAKKSSNPLSPHIAGPIPGVEISQPKLLEPGQGWKFKGKELPLTLLIENASSNGVRPLVYAIQIAVDAGFKNIVFTRRDIPQGQGGRTSMRMSDKLQLGRMYYWRAWAYDGANTGAMARSVSFEVYPPVVIREPALMSPADNATGVSLVPQLRVRNSWRSGPAGNLRYRYQVAADPVFSRLVTGNSAQPENVSAGTTLWTASGLSYSRTYYWRVQATDGETTSGWSVTWRFTTGASAPGPTGPPGSCASNNGTYIAQCIAAKYPDRLRPTRTLSARQTNMAFLRDRMIEAGKCGGMDLGWNLKRGGPSLSIDFLAWRSGGQDLGVDIGHDYDNYSAPLRLRWYVEGPGAHYKAYPAVPCT